MKRFFGLFLLVAFLTTAANAQLMKMGVKPDERSGGMARVEAMGGGNNFLVDPTNMLTNPAYAAAYYNFLWGDVGSQAGSPSDGNGQFAGFNFWMSKQLTLGVVLSRNDYAGPGISNVSLGNTLVSALNNAGAPLNAIALDNNFQVLAAFSPSSTTTLGLGLAFASSKHENVTAAGTDKASASQLGVNLGVLHNFSTEMALDLGVAFVMGSATSESGATKNEETGTAIAAKARMFFGLNNNLTFVPVAMFETVSGTSKQGATSRDRNSQMNFGVGAGLNYLAGKSILLTGGIELMMMSEKQAAVAGTSPELTDSRFIFPAWVLGAEWYVLDWLKARIGYRAASYSNTMESAATATTKNEMTMTGYDRTGMTLGVGFKFGSFNLDATINDEILREGFNLIGGGKQTFAHISASYAF